MFQLVLKDEAKFVIARSTSNDDGLMALETFLRIINEAEREANYLLSQYPDRPIGKIEVALMGPDRLKRMGIDSEKLPTWSAPVKGVRFDRWKIELTPDAFKMIG